MELGACICTVHQPPECSSCPIQAHCQARQDLKEYISQGGHVTGVDAPLVSQYPAKVHKETHTALMLRWPACYLQNKMMCTLDKLATRLLFIALNSNISPEF